MNDSTSSGSCVRVLIVWFLRRLDHGDQLQDDAQHHKQCDRNTEYNQADCERAAQTKLRVEPQTDNQCHKNHDNDPATCEPGNTCQAQIFHTCGLFRISHLKSSGILSQIRRYCQQKLYKNTKIAYSTQHIGTVLPVPIRKIPIYDRFNSQIGYAKSDRALSTAHVNTTCTATVPMSTTAKALMPIAHV